MKLCRLDLIAYGPFADLSIDFRGRNGAVHLIYGPNEAGKSSALRALHALLYGIPRRCDDDFRHPYDRLRIGGAIEGPDGDVLEVVRRKRGRTLRDGQDVEPVEESRLAALLGGVDAKQFETLFGIDHPELEKGGEEIVRGGGDLGQLLFAAGAGLAGFRRVFTGLQDEANALFLSAGKKPEINAGISEFRRLSKSVREAGLAASDWEKQHRAHEEAAAGAEAVRRELAEKSAERQRLMRIRDALIPMSRRRECLEEQKVLKDAPRLPENFSEVRQKAFEERRVIQARIAGAGARLNEIGRDLSRMEIPQELLNRADAVTGLHREMGGIQKAAADRPRLEGIRIGLRSEVREILKGLGREPDPDAAESLRIEKREIIAVRELSARHERLTERLAAIGEEMDKRAEHQKRLASEPTSAKAPTNTAYLREAVEAAGELGDLENRHRRLLEEIHESESVLEAEISALPFWKGEADGLAVLKIPSPETVEMHDQRIHEAEAEIRILKTESERLEKERSGNQSRLREAELGGKVPSEADLLAFRELRNAGWRLIRNRLYPEHRGDGDEADEIGGEAGFIRRFSVADSLPDAFEISIRKADDIGDRLRREADRVARKAAVLAESEKIEADRRHLSIRQKQAEDRLQHRREAWAACWEDTDIIPGSPKEMRGWCQRQMTLVRRIGELRAQKHESEKWERKLLHHREYLLHALSETDEAGIYESEFYESEMYASGGKAGPSFSRLLSTARQTLEKHEEMKNRRERMKAEQNRLHQEQEEAKSRLHRAEAELDHWRREWGKAVARLGLPPNASPAQAGAVMEALSSLFEKIREAEVIDRRIQGMDRDARAFARRTASLAETVALEISENPPEEIVAALNARLIRAEKQQTEMEGLQKQIRAEEAGFKKAEKEMAVIEARLEAMCAEAGCEAFEDLPEIETRSLRRRRIEERLEAADEQLRTLSGGTSLSAFVRSVEDADPDSLEPEILRLDTELETLNARKAELDRAVGGTEKALELMDGGSRAAELAEKSESVLARIHDDAERYARLRLAGEMLRRAIDTYREKHQGPLLSRSGNFFSRMTLGRFQGLRPEFNEKNEPILTGLRSEGETVPVKGMSEGTANQLYLAVRLAGLEFWMKKSGPMPFIADDILIKFDDARSAATLKILSELAQRTQIIYFTHHRHLVELAREYLSEGGVTVHELGENAV